MRRAVVNHKRSRHVDPAQPFYMRLMCLASARGAFYSYLGRAKTLTQARTHGRATLRKLRSAAGSLDKATPGRYEVWIFKDPVRGQPADADNVPVERIAWTA